MAKFFGKKWELDTTSRYSKGDEKGIIWSVPDEHEIMPLKIAMLHHSPRIKKGVLRANGRLIAAGPEMYELLRQARDVLLVRKKTASLGLKIEACLLNIEDGNKDKCSQEA